MRCVVIALSLLCSSLPALAVDSIHWKNVNGWNVLMDPTMGNACYVTTDFDGGITLRLGFDFTGTKGQLYLALGSADWKSIEDGKDYPIEIQFDNQPVWNATAQGADFAEGKWLHVTTENSNFATEFARKLGMRVRFNGKQIAALRLKGTSRAMDEMLACQDVTNKATAATRQAPPQKDPFATAPAVKNANDPFDL